MPERFLLQILRMLVTHGVLRSTRGVDGGYSLTKSPDKVSLLDVIEAIEGPMDSEQQAASPEEDGSDNLQTALQEVTQTARRQLEAIKLSKLLEPPQPPSRTAAEPSDIET